VVSQADAGCTVIGLGPPDGESKGIIDMHLPRDLLYYFACPNHWAAHTRKNGIDCSGGQRWLTNDAEITILTIRDE
jgi:hypothetical protein